MKISDDQLFDILEALKTSVAKTEISVATLTLSMQQQKEIVEKEKTELDIKLKPVFEVCEKFKAYENKGRGILLTISALSAILGYVAAKLGWL